MRTKWRIEGFDSTTPILEPTTVVLGSEQIQELLRRLACTSPLTPSEVIEASIGSNRLLEVSRFREGFSCGTNPHFSARRI